MEEAGQPREKGTEKMSMQVSKIEELLDVCPIVDVWHKRKLLGQGYVDGGAQNCVMTEDCVERMGFKITKVSGFRIRLANHQKIKCLGIVKGLEMEAYGVKTVSDFHVMSAGLGAFAVILGRPWLRAVHAVQDWKRGTISLSGKSGSKKICDMDARKPKHEDIEDEDESSEEESSTVTESEIESSSDSEEEADVSFLLVDEESDECGQVAAVEGIEEAYEGPYEIIEELMQPKVDVAKKQELVVKMISGDISAMEREKYVSMLASFPELFITSYEEIRGFKGEDMRIELKEGARPVR